MRSSTTDKARDVQSTTKTPSAAKAPDGLPQLLTVKEVAAVLRVATRTVHRLIKSGQLPKLNIGRSVRVDVSALGAVIGPR
jgi:excisionase family DNA binding protein